MSIISHPKDFSDTCWAMNNELTLSYNAYKAGKLSRQDCLKRITGVVEILKQIRQDYPTFDANYFQVTENLAKVCLENLSAGLSKYETVKITTAVPPSSQVAIARELIEECVQYHHSSRLTAMVTKLVELLEMLQKIDSDCTLSKEKKQAMQALYEETVREIFPASHQQMLL